MIVSGYGVGQIILAALLLNLRHLLKGASLAPYLTGVKSWKVALLANGLNDESYALPSAAFTVMGAAPFIFSGPE